MRYFSEATPAHEITSQTTAAPNGRVLQPEYGHCRVEADQRQQPFD